MYGRLSVLPDRLSRCSGRSSWRRCRSGPRSSAFAIWLRALVWLRTSTRRSRPSRKATARSPPSGLPNSTTASPPVPAPGRRRGSALRARAQHPCNLRGACPACRLLRFRSARVRFTEIDLFGVYVAPISLMMVAAWLVTIALRRRCRPFRLAAPRLASGAVRVRRLHDRSLVHRSDRRALRWLMSIVELEIEARRDKAMEATSRSRRRSRPDNCSSRRIRDRSDF